MDPHTHTLFTFKFKLLLRMSVVEGFGRPRTSLELHASIQRRHPHIWRLNYYRHPLIGDWTIPMGGCQFVTRSDITKPIKHTHIPIRPALHPTQERPSFQMLQWFTIPWVRIYSCTLQYFVRLRYQSLTISNHPPALVPNIKTTVSQNYITFVFFGASLDTCIVLYN